MWGEGAQQGQESWGKGGMREVEWARLWVRIAETAGGGGGGRKRGWKEEREIGVLWDSNLGGKWGGYVQ